MKPLYANNRGHEPLEDLPQPAPADRARSDALQSQIITSIKAGDGFIGFDDYMDAVLYAPGYGYYVVDSAKFGPSGDFVTAPELGQLFGRCLARQCEELIEHTGGTIVEFGAGTGALASAILSNLSVLPGQYVIVETSPDLVGRQRTTLERLPQNQRQCVSWVNKLPETIDGIVLANEVIDAMPVTRFVIESDGIAELGVGSDGESLGYRLKTTGDAATQLLERFGRDELPVGYCSEYNPRAEAWIATLAERIGCGAILAIDYGYSKYEYYHPSRLNGTLRCHYRHRAHEDALLWPGLQDITAHVDFTAMVNAGVNGGLALSGYTTLANFLMSLGLIDIAGGDVDDSQQGQLNKSREIQKLTDPGAMGESFKVMCLTRGIDAELCGFQARDLRRVL